MITFQRIAARSLRKIFPDYKTGKRLGEDLQRERERVYNSKFSEVNAVKIKEMGVFYGL